MLFYSKYFLLWNFFPLIASVKILVGKGIVYRILFIIGIRILVGKGVQYSVYDRASM